MLRENIKKLVEHEYCICRRALCGNQGFAPSRDGKEASRGTKAP